MSKPREGVMAGTTGPRYTPTRGKSLKLKTRSRVRHLTDGKAVPGDDRLKRGVASRLLFKISRETCHAGPPSSGARRVSLSCNIGAGCFAASGWQGGLAPFRLGRFLRTTPGRVRGGYQRA